MKIIYILIFVCTLSLHAGELRHNFIQNDQSACAESQSLRIHFREKTDALRDRNLIHPDMHKAIVETIRTRPIHELEQLFTLIEQTHHMN